MVVDTSALIAMFLAETGSDLFLEAIMQSRFKVIAAPTLVEAAMVAAGKKGADALPRLDQLVSELQIDVLAFGVDHAQVAKRAFLRYGKGRHPAQLNFGDCISYAVSKVEAMPLLFKGGDFRLTDIDAVV